MTRTKFALVLGFISYAATMAAAPTFGQKAACPLGPPTTVLVREGDQAKADGRLLVRWDVPSRAAFDSTADPTSDPYRAFRSDLRERGIVTDARRALGRSPTANNRIVASHAREWIKPATCLEKYLYGLQHARIPTFEEPTEFSAFVLSSQNHTKTRIYWYSVNRNGIGNATPLTDPVRKDVTAGWRVRYVLHSHPFKPSDDLLNGIIAPSGPDASFQANMRRAIRLPEARITNGVDTVRIPASAFDNFEQ